MGIAGRNWDLPSEKFAKIGLQTLAFTVLASYPHFIGTDVIHLAKSECHALGVAKQNYERMFAVLILLFDPSIRLGFFAFLFFFFFLHSWRGLWWQNPPLLYRLFSLNCKTTNHRSNAMVLLTVPTPKLDEEEDQNACKKRFRANTIVVINRSTKYIWGTW